MKVYVAGWPTGHLATHLRHAEDALRQLADAGLAPLVPQFYLYASGPRVWGPTVYAVAYQPPADTNWPNLMLPWLRSADAVLRLGDHDWESKAAELLGIPVFTEADSVLAWAAKFSTDSGCSVRTHAL